MKYRIFAGSLALFAAAATSAAAAPVTFEFASTVSLSTFSGVSEGDKAVYQIFADNGSDSLLDQTWDRMDYLGARVNFGGGRYIADFDADSGADFDAKTDGAGTVISFFLDDDSGNSDTNGGTDIFLTLNGLRLNLFANPFLFDSADVSTPDNFSVRFSEVAAIPLPASLPLLVLGLGGLGLARKKRKAT